MKRRRRSRLAAQPRCVLDSGGVTAMTGNSQRARTWLRWIVEHGGAIVVPTPVLVEIVTGDAGRDAGVNRILNILERAASVLSPPDERTSRLAGRLRFRGRGDDGIDALVAAVAVGDGAPCVLLTSDPDDLGRLLVDAPQVAVRTV